MSASNVELLALIVFLALVVVVAVVTFGFWRVGEDVGCLPGVLSGAG
ncbi:hypothetical protein ACUH9Y_02505 [Dermabacteraceae bacterium P13115]